jgi:hypothetical protein
VGLATGCKGKDADNSQTTTQSKAVEQKSLYYHVPENSVVFMKTSLNKDKHIELMQKQLKNFDMAKFIESFKQQVALDEAQKPQLDLFISIYNSLISEGLLPNDKDGGVFEEMIGAGEIEIPSRKMTNSLILKSKIPAEMVISKLELALKKNEAQDKFKLQKISGTELNLTFGENKDITVYITGKGNLIAASSDNAQAKKILQPNEKLAPVVVEAQNKINNLEEELWAVFTYIKGLVDRNKDNQKKDTDVPIDSFQLSGGFENDMLRTHGAIDIREQSPLANNVIKTLVDNKVDKISPLPPKGDLAVEIKLSANLLNALMELAEQSPTALNANNKEGFELIRKLGNLDLGLVLGNVSSPYPEIYVAAHGPEVSSLKNIVKEMISQLGGPMLGSSNGLAWQEKEVATLKTDAITTPFGIGLFLAEHESNLILATGEAGIKLRGLVSEGTSIRNDQLLKKATNLNTDTPLLSFYFDQEKIVKILKDVNTIAAPFTGGQAVIEESYITQVNQPTEVLGVVKVNNKRVELFSWTTIEEPKQKNG